MLYKVPLILDPQPEGGSTVTSPLLPELVTEGDTIDEALVNVKDALSALIEAFTRILESHFLVTPRLLTPTARSGWRSSSQHLDLSRRRSEIGRGWLLRIVTQR